MDRRKYDEKYRQSEKGKATARAYNQSKQRKTTAHEYAQTEKGKEGIARRNARYRNKEEKRSISAEANRRWRLQLKHETLVAYSQEPPSCACCGETIEAFLTIDHINGGGKHHRASVTKNISGFYVALRKAGFPQDQDLQVLCFNCNCGKRANGGFCPHQTPV